MVKFILLYQLEIFNKTTVCKFNCLGQYKTRRVSHDGSNTALCVANTVEVGFHSDTFCGQQLAIIKLENH